MWNITSRLFRRAIQYRRRISHVGPRLDLLLWSRGSLSLWTPLCQYIYKLFTAQKARASVRDTVFTDMYVGTIV